MPQSRTGVWVSVPFGRLTWLFFLNGYRDLENRKKPCGENWLVLTMVHSSWIAWVVCLLGLMVMVFGKPSLLAMILLMPGLLSTWAIGIVFDSKVVFGATLLRCERPSLIFLQSQGVEMVKWGSIFRDRSRVLTGTCTIELWMTGSVQCWSFSYQCLKVLVWVPWLMRIAMFRSVVLVVVSRWDLGIFQWFPWNPGMSL